MELTFIGAIQIIVGLVILVAGSLRSALFFLMISCLFNGSAAIKLTAIGSSSLAPMQLALVFAVLRIVWPGSGYIQSIPEVIRANKWLFFYTLFAVIIGYAGPRIFEGTIDVTPLRPNISAALFATAPLKPTTQNLTATLYIVGAFLLTVTSYVTCRHRGGAATVVSGFVWLGALHVFFGIISVLAYGTPIDAMLDLFRNNSYAQLGHEYGNFVRIRGLSPEASSYAGLGFCLFVANCELWFRLIRPTATGSVAFALAIVLFFSTSSTAYVALLTYGLIVTLRSIVVPDLLSAYHIKAIAKTFGFLIFSTAIILAAVPGVPSAVWEMIRHMTIDKPDSSSGQQRLFWALQGWEAFKASYGLGIGPGSFRSSSIITAILGSTGIIGTVSFVAYMIVVLQPWRRSSWGYGRDLPNTLGGGFAAAAIFTLIPGTISSSHMEPIEPFAILAGASLAIRRLAGPSGSQASSDAQGNGTGSTVEASLRA